MEASSPKPDADKFLDGLYHFQVKRPDGSITSESIDVMILKTIIDDVTDTHFPTAATGDKLKVTAAFLTDLAAQITQYGVLCSPSLAYQLWFAGSKGMDLLKKNTSEPLSSPTGSESSQPTEAEPPKSESGPT